MTRRGSKVGAARILSGAGWSEPEIASATAARAEDVHRWLMSDDYQPTTRREPHPCHQCGATDAPLRNNGWCPSCTAARHLAVVEMADQGLSHREIADAVGMARGAIRGILYGSRRAA